MSTTTENVDANVTESSAEVVTATETTQIKKVRHSPLHITVVLPNNRRILIPSVNPSEPTSYLKQTLQEYHESAQYTSYTFETADKVTISDYVEIANYSPPDEEVSTMVVHLVPSHYDVKKSRLQLKRVREMIAYPPNAKGAIADSETGAEKTEAAATTSIISPVRDAAEQDRVDLSKKIETLQLESASASDEVTESKSDMSCAPAIASTVEESNPTTAVSSDEVAPVKIVEVTAVESEASQPALLPQESTATPVSAVKTVIDLNQNKEEKTLSLIVDSESSDDHNSPSNESKDGSSLEVEEEKSIIVEVKSSILDDDGIKVTGMDAVVEPETKQLTNVSDNVKKLPSEKSIFRPILLSEFFAETLLRVGSNEGANNQKNAEVTSENKGSIKVKAPSECVRSVSASGWNPPPLGRKLQGDLLYIEAVTEEGVFHVTSTPKGFFVNRCTRTVFDPRPAPNPHFSHELFTTLLDVSSSLRASWHSICANANASVDEGEEGGDEGSESEELNADSMNSGALDVVTALCSQGREDLMFIRPPWNVATPGTFSTPEKNISNEEKSLKFLKNKKLEDNKKTSAELSRLADRINSNKSVINDSVRGSKSDVIVPQYSSHNFDLSRLHDDLCDQFGAEDPGAPREWNEEMQSVRTFKSDNISEKVMKAKYIHNIYQEFRDAVKTGALAISDGHIAPMNPLDPEKAHVYVYNNIFYSQAVESKESFKICDGDDASRKLAGHDLKNQRMIQSLDVDGLCTVLSCIVDFKGARLIGQTIIPGVLQVGVHSARLLYGAIERGKRLTVKNEGLKLMKSLFSELFMVERKIQAIPNFTVYPTGDENEDTVATVPIKMDYFGLGEEENQATSVEIDFEDDVVDANSEVVPHIGCLEIKLLKGTDGRAYVLDAMRLTPIDANYVKGPKGTGNFPLETLSLINNNVSTAYVLRHELISSYSQHKAALQRQDMIRKELQIHREKMMKKEAENEIKMKEMLAECDRNIIKDSTSEEKDGHKEMKGIELPAAVTAPAAVAAAVEENEKDISSVSAQKQEQNKNENKTESKTETESKDGKTKEVAVAVKKLKEEKEVNGDKEESNEKVEDEVEEDEVEEEEEEEDLISKFDELTKQSMAGSLQLNANCFIDGFECDADPVTALKDEESARDLAHYLFKQVTVSLTEQIRVGDMSPLDNEGMVDLLHTHGVNMRYLGRMAHLAHTQEAQDIDLLLSNRQRIQAMPLFWLEMIEIEVIARCFKHHLNRLYRENKDIRQSPSPTIATLLNHILGQSVTSTSTATTITPHNLSAENSVHTNTNISVSGERKRNDTEKDNLSKLKKKKIKHCHLSEDCSISIPELCDAGGSRGDCIGALGAFAATRFGLLQPALINFKAGNENNLGGVVGDKEKTVVEREGEVVEKGDGEKEGTVEDKEGTVGEKKEADKEKDKDSAAVAADENKLSSLPFLNDRITRLTLLRRLCQIAGLRITSRDFDFSSPHPFSRDDIISVVPLVRSAQQTTPIPEVADIISNARSCIEEGDLTGAFELSQDASRLLHQITGPLHKETVMSTNLITQILLEARNNSLALTMAFKSLSISVQLAGLDSQDAAQHHGQVASLLCDLGYPFKALQHFLAMRYLIELMAGPRHPELVNVYLRLVSIYEQQREYVTAQVLLAAAKDLCVDVAKQCMISTTVAEIYDKMGELSNAVNEQRAVLRTMVQLFGPKDEKSIEAKSKVEKYLRKLTVSNVNAARGVGNNNEKVNLLRDLEENIKKAMKNKGTEKGKVSDGKGDVRDDDYLQLIAEGESKKDEKKKSNSSNKKKSKSKSKK